MFEFEPVVKRRLHDEVLDRLTKAILSGEIAPGSKLPSERDLMDRFNVGRPSVREALRELEAAGMLRIAHGERAQVLSPTPDDLTRLFGQAMRALLWLNKDALGHLQEARLAFERFIAAEAARNGTDEELTRLEAALQAMYASRHDPAAFTHNDGQFHGILAEMSGNAIYAAVSRGLFTWLSEHHVASVHAPGRTDVTLLEHRAVLEAVAAKDPERAAEAMTQHLKRSRIG